MKPITRNGIKSFLAEAFGGNCNGKATPHALAKQLFNYKDVGQVVHQRPFSKKNKFVASN